MSDSDKQNKQNHLITGLNIEYLQILNLNKESLLIFKPGGLLTQEEVDRFTENVRKVLPNKILVTDDVVNISNSAEELYKIDAHSIASIDKKYLETLNLSKDSVLVFQSGGLFTRNEVNRFIHAFGKLLPNKVLLLDYLVKLVAIINPQP